MVNTILDNLPFELHALGYNFLGPGTKINKRVARGDVSINPLDEAAKKRSVQLFSTVIILKLKVDEYLTRKIKEKSWDRVLFRDADLRERSLVLETTAGIRLKRK